MINKVGEAYKTLRATGLEDRCSTVEFRVDPAFAL